MTGRTRLLGLYVQGTSAVVEWGRSDCSTWPAQWVAEATGRPVEWPVYASEDDARALITAAGGLVPLWRDVARATCLRERDAAVEAPVCGDIGVITTRRFGPCGVIFGPLSGVGDGPWLAYWRAEGGARPIAVRRATILAAWEV